jgi:ActR/RegA family two-component response regulator
MINDKTLRQDLLYTALSQIPDGMSAEEIRVGYICEILRRTDGNRTKTAKWLKSCKRTIHRALANASANGITIPTFIQILKPNGSNRGY